MSETTSFLGGAALAGLTAVVLLRGGVSANSPALSTSPTSPSYPPYPTLTPSPQSTAPAAASGAPTSEEFEKQRQETEQLKSLLEQQRLQTEQLKTQIQSQQTLIDTMTAQNKVNGFPTPRPAPSPEPEHRSNALGIDQRNPIMTGLMWALGGVILTFGGGLALVGMFVLFAKQQRPSRTIEVIHDQYPEYLPTRRRPQALPPRRAIRRVEAEDVD
jgi:hypothetical protein